MLFAHLPRDYPAENSIYYGETLRSSEIDLLRTYKGFEAGAPKASSNSSAETIDARRVDAKEFVVSLYSDLKRPSNQRGGLPPPSLPADPRSLKIALRMSGSDRNTGLGKVVGRCRRVHVLQEVEQILDLELS